MSKKIFILIILTVLAALGAAYYWFFIKIPIIAINTNVSSGNLGNGIFAPFGQNNNSNGTAGSNASSTGSSTSPTAISVPAVREISALPVGGMISSTTASTTILLWIDRGTGHIYQAYADNTAVDQISNTTIPMIYESYWNTAANAFIFSSLTENSDTVANFYTILIPNTEASTSSSTTEYSLAGSPLSLNTLAIAVSPPTAKRSNQAFTLVDDGNGGAAGYISNFDGSKKTQVFDTPLQQLNVQWPSANLIALTTKGTSAGAGFLYFVNPKEGVFNKILGGMNGLSTLVNSDGSEVLYSYANASRNGIITSVLNLTTGQSQILPFSTLADKCVWSSLQKNDLYCAIPSNIPSAAYPDAWYQGTMSFNDSLWEIDTVTGDVHELVDLDKTAGQPIDAENLQLSPKEDFMYFMNKKDLSLWSFDLNAI